MPKPSIDVHPAAGRDAGRNERMIGFSAPSGAGGLITLALQDDGTITLHVHGHSNTAVTVGEADGE